MKQAAESLVLRQWGARKMTLISITLRRELIQFYQRLGYRLTGEVVPFPPEAAVRARVDGIELEVLEKDLVAASPPERGQKPAINEPHRTAERSRRKSRLLPCLAVSLPDRPTARLLAGRP